MNTSRTRITIAALPGLVMLALFYSLALHMHQSLGGWPTSIGERGFPPALVVHSAITVNVFCLFRFSPAFSSSAGDVSPFISPFTLEAANAGQRLGFAVKSRVGLSPLPGVAEFHR